MKLLEQILYTSQMLLQNHRKVEVGRELWDVILSRPPAPAETARATYPGSCPDCASISLLPSLGTTGKSLAPSSLQPPFRPFYTLIRSPLSLLFTRLNSPSLLSLSSEERCSSASDIFMALCWTLSRTCISLLYRAAQNRTQCPRCGITSAKQRGRITTSACWQNSC